MSVPDPVTTGVVIASALQVAKQAQDFIAAAAGHPGESIGTILGNLGRRRFDNIEAVGNKAHLILLNIGLTPAEVPLSVLHPLLEAASVQEDSALQDTWANLLANAADPRKTTPMAAAFPAMLKELGAREVKFLDALYDARFPAAGNGNPHVISGQAFDDDDLRNVYVDAGLTRQPRLAYLTFGDLDRGGADLTKDIADFNFSMNVIMRQNILNQTVVTTPIDLRDILRSDNAGHIPDSIEIRTTERYDFTEMGGALVKACRPPDRNKE